MPKINKINIKNVLIVVFIIVFMIFIKNNLNNKNNDFKTITKPSTQIPWREPIKINNDFSSSINSKKVTVDVVLPLYKSGNLKYIMDQLESWDKQDALPCGAKDKFKSKYYSGSAESNLIFYLNTVGEKEKERISSEITDKVESAIWRKCFNQIKFVQYTDDAEENSDPSKEESIGLTEMFYKYFIIGSTSDYFFWMDSNVNVIRMNWQIELCRLVVETIVTRSNQAFYMMGGTYVGNGLAQYQTNSTDAWEKQLPMYINGNALYWNSRSFYDGFLDRVKHSNESIGAFDVDIAIFLKTRNNWGIVKNIRLEFIILDFVRNYNNDDYNKQEILNDYSRTYFTVKLLKNKQKQQQQ